MQGVVNPRLEATLSIQVFGPSGQMLDLVAAAVEGDPLIGTALLMAYTLEAKFVGGGTVTIEAPP